MKEEGATFLSALDRDQLRSVARAAVPLVVRAKETIIVQGDEGKFCYFIDFGTYVVRGRPSCSILLSGIPAHLGCVSRAIRERPDPWQSLPLQAIKDGQEVRRYEGSGSFGAQALFHNAPRAASVFAVTAGRLWSIDRPTFRNAIVLSNRKRRDAAVAILGDMPAFRILKMDERQLIADW